VCEREQGRQADTHTYIYIERERERESLLSGAILPCKVLTQKRRWWGLGEREDLIDTKHGRKTNEEESLMTQRRWGGKEECGGVGVG
jgi:hypothetical protein